MRSRVSLLIAFVLPVLACAAPAREGVRSKGGGDAPGDPAAAATLGLRDSDGRGATLSSVIGGRPSLVNFWAPWCEPCVKELPVLEKLLRGPSPCAAAPSSAWPSARSPMPAIASKARARALTYPQLTDEPFAVADALGQRRIPATVVFDRAGRVVFSGDTVDARATAALAHALGDAPDAKACALP